MSDLGLLISDKVEASVETLFKAPRGQSVHIVTIRSGELHVGDTVTAQVDAPNRNDIIKNHTATHLMHKALKEVLGNHANQAGSLVEAERLRFDFSHFSSVTPEELADIERRVNQEIWKGLDVEINYMPIDDAKSLGAMALFGEKIRRYRTRCTYRRLQHRAVWVVVT